MFFLIIPQYNNLRISIINFSTCQKFNFSNPMFNFKKERLIQPPIGEGAYGEVFSYQKNSQDSRWVVKRPIGKKVEDIFSCLPEIVLGFSCDHPCIVPVKGYSIQPTDDNRYEIYINCFSQENATFVGVSINKKNSYPFSRIWNCQY